MKAKAEKYQEPAPPKVRMSFTWDESFVLVRALERSIVAVENLIKISTDPAFWQKHLDEDKAALKKVQAFRVRALGEEW